MHIWLRNGFTVFLLLGFWLKPPCRLSIAVLNELAFAAAYIAVSIVLVKAYDNVCRRYGDRARRIRCGILLATQPVTLASGLLRMT